VIILNKGIKTVCPKCGSTKIFKFRLDSDWCAGAGDYTPENDKSEYTAEEWTMDALDRPDIDIFHCRNCDFIWE